MQTNTRRVKMMDEGKLTKAMVRNRLTRWQTIIQIQEGHDR